MKRLGVFIFIVGFPHFCSAQALKHDVSQPNSTGAGARELMEASVLPNPPSCHLLTDGSKLKSNSEAGGGNSGLAASANWAHEYVGLDLAQKKWNEWAVSNKEYHHPVAGVVDATFHARDVGSILSRHLPNDLVKPLGGKEGGLGANLGLLEASTNPDPNAKPEDYLHLDNDFIMELTSGGRPDVINLSLGSLSAQSYKNLQGLSETGTLISMSAGNRGADKSGVGNFEPRKDDFRLAVFTGMICANGKMHPESSPYSNVTIAAPGAGVRGKDGNAITDAGTSYAAPLTSSALVYLKSVLPEIDVTGAKTLLSATALPTDNASENPRLNGAGTLNAYGLLEAAMSVRNSDPYKKASTPEARVDAINAGINDFKEKAKSQRGTPADPQLMIDVKNNFGYNANEVDKSRYLPCQGPEQCAQRQEVFENLRQRAYQNPNVARYWDALSFIHQNMGFEANAQFYKSLSVNAAERY